MKKITKLIYSIVLFTICFFIYGEVRAAEDFKVECVYYFDVVNKEKDKTIEDSINIKATYNGNNFIFDFETSKSSDVSRFDRSDNDFKYMKDGKVKLKCPEKLYINGGCSFKNGWFGNGDIRNCDYIISTKKSILNETWGDQVLTVDLDEESSKIYDTDDSINGEGGSYQEPNEGTENPGSTIPGVEASCDLIDSEIWAEIRKILSWVQILVPIIIIAMGMIDFSKAVLADDQAAIKKATGNFVKRLIVGVAIFLIPIVLDVILKLVELPEVQGSLCKDELGL